jgi:hypothetical protein
MQRGPSKKQKNTNTAACRELVDDSRMGTVVGPRSRYTCQMFEFRKHKQALALSFLLPAWPSLYMCHLFCIRSLVSWSWSFPFSPCSGFLWGNSAPLFFTSQVKLLITNNAFCIVQRARAQSKTGIFRDYGVAEAPPGFQAGWSDCMYFFLLFLFTCLLIWVFRVSFCTHEGTLPYRSLAQMSCREEVGVFFTCFDYVVIL